MAEIPLGIMGPISGKIGPIVGCICRTRSNYIRTRPLCYHDAKTPEQLRNRETMKTVMAFMSKAREFARCTFGPVAKTMTTTNVATKLNFHKVRVEGNDDVRLEYSRLRLSYGKMLPLDSLVLLNEEGRLWLRWKSLIDTEYSGPTDWVHVLVYNESRHGEVTELEAGRRSDECVELQIPEKWKGDRLHVYVSVSDVRKEHFGNSQYIGFDGSEGNGSWESEENGGGKEVNLVNANKFTGSRLTDTRRNSIQYLNEQSAIRVHFGLGYGRIWAGKKKGSGGAELDFWSRFGGPGDRAGG